MRQRISKSMSFRVCLYPSEEEKGYFVAHCLELDVFGEGTSVEQAISELFEVIETQIESCEATGAQLQFFAPSRVWQKYQLARKANRTIAGDLLDRIVKEANQRLGVDVPNIFDNVVGTDEIPEKYLAVV